MAKRAIRTLLFIAATALPTTAGHSADRDGVAAAVAADVAFASSFAQFETLPPAPVATSGAVDIDSIEPVTETAGTPLGSGTASFYGRAFDGRRTASGEVFRMNEMTAAHRTLPFGSRVRVTNPSNGKSVVVRINDRGPFHGGRVIDVSRAAATELGLVARGHGTVELALVD
ncbi:septal ring lytic transglycosylase RlpA family protein [Qipengyuania sp. RANM35]|uniref:septal ring lytic transglycosylase RlpA family protein n=1 Tax=Qipengyuania sp. RANM35 TaxID=3068635 RepID=UPI0034DB253D